MNFNMKKFLLLISVSFFVLSCNGITNNDGLPDENEIENLIKSKVEKLSNENISFSEFKKTDALKEKVFEVENYTVKFEGKLIYLKDGFLSNRFSERVPKLLLFSLNEDKNHNQKIDEGSEKKVEGTARLLKTENGWKLHNRRGISIRDKK